MYRSEPISFDQMMNQGLKQFQARRTALDSLSHKDAKKLIRSIASVTKCSPETAQSCMYLC